MWNDGEDKVYTVKSAYQKLQEASICLTGMTWRCLWGGLYLPHRGLYGASRWTLNGGRCCQVSWYAGLLPIAKL